MSHQVSRGSPPSLPLSLWRVVDAIRPSFDFIDTLAEKRGSHSHHVYLDRILGRLRGKTPLFPFGFFPDGFGDYYAPSQFMDDLAAAHYPPPPLAVSLSPSKTHTKAGVRVQEGHFTTPYKAGNLNLPSECLTAHFQLLEPLCWDSPSMATPASAASANPAVSTAPSSGSSPLTEEEASIRQEMCRLRPVAVLLAGTGEQGYSRRRHFMSLPLARLGVASLILESPYYGARRPAKQVASKLRSVSDLPTLGRVTIDEARALTHYLIASGRFGPVVLTGNSMGGLHAAMVASVSQELEVGVASWLGPPTADHVFCEGVLSESCDWASLARQAGDPRLEEALCEFEEKLRCRGIDPEALRSVASTASSHQTITADKASSAQAHLAKQQLSRFLTITDINNFGCPRRPDAAVFVVAKHDQYIPAHGAIANKWQLLQHRWPGARVEWIAGGHVSAILFPRLNPTRVVVGVVKALARV